MAFLNSRQLTAIKEFHDELIESFQKTCKLIHQPKFVSCNQCLKPVDSRYLNNTGLHGGPIVSFCSICGGTNQIAQEVSENISVTINWSPKPKGLDIFSSVGAPNTKSPYGLVLIHGFLTDLPKLQKCIEVHIDLPLEPIVVGRYKLAGEGSDPFSINPGRYFIQYLERIV